MDEGLLGEMLMQNLCRVHPSKVVELSFAKDELFEGVQILIVFCVFEEIDVFVLFNWQNVESGVISLLYFRNCYEPDEWNETMGGRDQA
jgi:hypothetical protein